MMIYIAADRPAPLVPWNPASPNFHVTVPGETDGTAVATLFTKPHVYYLGSHEGCGCGFAYEPWPVDDDDPEGKSDNIRKRQVVADLARYLERLVGDAGPVELYACWAGDEGQAPASRGSMRPSQIGGESFAFTERQFLVIERDDA